MHITHWSILVRGELPKPSPLTWCPPSPHPRHPGSPDPGQESHRMLRLELETSRGRWFAACPPHVTPPTFGVAGASRTPPWTSERKKKSPASSSVGTFFAQRPRSMRHRRKRARLGGLLQAYVQLGVPPRSAKQASRDRQNSLKPGSLSFPRTKEAREQAVISFSPSISLALEQGCGDESGLESRASTSSDLQMRSWESWGRDGSFKLLQHDSSCVKAILPSAEDPGVQQRPRRVPRVAAGL